MLQEVLLILQKVVSYSTEVNFLAERVQYSSISQIDHTYL